MANHPQARSHLRSLHIASGDIDDGLAVVLHPTRELTVEVAPPGASNILGVTVTKALDGEPITVEESRGVVEARRDPSFTADAARTDRLGVGAGGAFIPADGAPGVVVVRAAETNGGNVLVEVTGPGTAIVGTSLIAHDVVAGEEGVGGVIVEQLGYTPTGLLVQRWDATGPLSGDLQSYNVGYEIVPGSPSEIRLTGQNPQPHQIGDRIMILVRE